MNGRGETPAEDDVLGCYEEGAITRVDAPTKPDGWWSVSCGDCWGCGMPPGDVEPKVGDWLRVYGRLGSPFHGQAINGQVLWYKTSAEMEDQHRQQVAKMDADARARFEEQREQLDRDYGSLPWVLRVRMDRFRAANPDFRWKYESYEMFVCTQATLLHDWAVAQPDPTGAIAAWSALPFAEQLTGVPGWSDAHSGNTHGCAVALAREMLVSRERPALMSAALAPIVGTADLSEAT